MRLAVFNRCDGLGQVHVAVPNQAGYSIGDLLRACDVVKVSKEQRPN